MSTAPASNRLGFQANRGAHLEFRSGNREIILKKAYSLNGKSYDIRYGTSITEMQKLKRMEPALLIQTLQEQIRVGLDATSSHRFPEKVRFSSENGKIYAWQAGRRTEISGQWSSTTGRTMRTMMELLSREHALLQSIPHSDTAPAPAARAVASAPAPIPKEGTRLKISEEFKKNWLDNETSILYGGIVIGPLRFLAGLVLLIVNLIGALFSGGAKEYLEDAKEALEHMFMGLFSTIASIIVDSILLIALPYTILILLIK